MPKDILFKLQEKLQLNLTQTIELPFSKKLSVYPLSKQRLEIHGKINRCATQNAYSMARVVCKHM